MRRLLIGLVFAALAQAQLIDMPTQVRRQPVVDVRTHFARGDGVTDDATAFQNAINSVGSGNAVEIHLPGPLTYLLNSSPSANGRSPVFYLHPGATTTGVGTLPGVTVTLDSTGTFTSILGAKHYTVATLPAATTAGKLIYVTDGTNGSNPCTGSSTGSLAMSTGSAWNCAFGGGGGGGTLTLNGLATNPQSFAKIDDTNVSLVISSVGSTHTFTMGWVSTLAKARLNGQVVHTDQANTYTAGMKQLFVPDGTTAGARISAAVLPSSPVTGDLAIDSGASNIFKWYDGTVWRPIETTLTFTAPLSKLASVVSIPAASGSVDGYLSQIDWGTFNGKAAAAACSANQYAIQTTNSGIVCAQVAYSQISGTPTGTNYSQAFTSQTSVALTHNLTSSNIIVACYDGSDVEIGYNSLTINSANQATVTFAVAQTGRCVVNGLLIGGGGAGTMTDIGPSGSPQAGPSIILATGTSGSDFNIAGAANTITYHLPDASPSNRGALTSGNFSTFNGKAAVGSCPSNQFFTSITSSAVTCGEQTYNTVAVGGSNQTQRSRWNLVAGTGISLTPVDDAGGNKTDITVALSGSTASGTTLPTTVRTSSTLLTIGGECTAGLPCKVRIGNTVYSMTAAFTGTLSGAATGTAYISWDPSSGTKYITHNLTVSCSGCTQQTGTAYPADHVALARVTATTGAWDVSGISDDRATSAYSVGVGSGLSKSISSGLPTISVDSTVRTRYFGCQIGDGVSVITTGEKMDCTVTVPVGGTVVGWRLLETSGTSGSISLDVWKDTYANYPPTNADTMIATGTKPSITATTKNESTSPDWATLSISAGDVIRFEVETVATVKQVIIAVEVRI